MTTRTTSGSRTWMMPLAWIACGFVLFFVLFFDPLGLHPVDGWLQQQMGFHTDARETADVRESSTLWTCPMHPHILEEEPGSCPICGMDLVEASAPASPVGSPSSADVDREIVYYRNPMDPTITSPVPATDEMGMDYVPIYADEVEDALGAGSTVSIDPVVVQNMNVTTAEVVRKDLAREVRSVGYLEYDQERMVTVTTKYDGWVEKVYVNYVGEAVRRGQPLFEIYSPELVQTELELLSAIEYARKFESADDDTRRRAMGLVEAARSRLGYWDVSASQIEQLEATGEIFRTLTVVSPASGVVMKRMAGLEGMAVRPGMETFHVANLSSLWLSVELFEDQLAWVSVGAKAEVSFNFLPEETLSGTVQIIEPELSEKTRTLRAKLRVPNRSGKLRAGMYATVVFRPVAATDVLAIPVAAVIRTGERSIVIVDAGGGRFQPRPVSLGYEGGGYVGIRSGLEEGERVVTSSQFLIDSEASLQEAIQKMLRERSRDGREGSDDAL